MRRLENITHKINALYEKTGNRLFLGMNSELFFLRDLLEKDQTLKGDRDALIDSFRKRLYSVEDLMQEILNRGENNPELASVITELNEIYEDLIRQYDPELRFIFNVKNYQNLLGKEKQYGFPLMKRHLKTWKTIGVIPGREPRFTGRVNNLKHIFANFAGTGKTSLCISGLDPGDENAGVGKTVLAQEVVNLIAAPEYQLDDYPYLNDHPDLEDAVMDAREKFAQGVIWVSLQSYKKNPDTYLSLIAEAIGEKYTPVKKEETDPMAAMASAPDNNPGGIANEIFETISQEGKMVEEQRHSRLDCIEKLALVLNARKILLVLDNVEQDRTTFEYLYSRFRGFVSILITCRIKLAGIPAHLVSPFTWEEASQYYASLNQKNIPEGEELAARQVFALIRYNPYCISLLAYNLNQMAFPSFYFELEKAIGHLSHLSTVRIIMAVLDATKAISDEEKSLLFDASVFFKEHFSAFELWCFSPLKTESEVADGLHKLYDEKRLVLIHVNPSENEGAEEIRYRIHQSIKHYLKEWFEKKEGIYGKKDEEARESLLKRQKSIEEILTERQMWKQLELYFWNIRVDGFLELQDDVKKQLESVEPTGKAITGQKYKAEVIEMPKSTLSEISRNYLHLNDNPRARFFVQLGIRKYTEDQSYFEYLEVFSFSSSGDIIQCKAKGEEKLRKYDEPTLRNEVSGFIQSAIGEVFPVLRGDYYLSGFHEKLLNWHQTGIVNRMVAIQDIFYYLVYMESGRPYALEIIQAFEDYKVPMPEDWEFKIVQWEFDYYLPVDPARSRQVLDKLTQLAPEFYQDSNAAEIINGLEFYYYYFQQNWEKAAEWIEKLGPQTIHNKRVDVAYTWLRAMKEGKAQEEWNTLKKGIKDNPGSQADHLFLSAAKAFLQGDLAAAAVFLEQNLAFQDKFLFLNKTQELALKKEIITAVGGEAQYLQLLKGKDLKSEYELPVYFNFPEKIDSKGEMIYIPVGRMFPQDKMPLLIDMSYIAENAGWFMRETYLENQAYLFSNGSMMYDFYVDAQLVTEDEFRYFFANLPLEERQEYPLFNAENVIKYAKAHDKKPLTKNEWIKIYQGINHNLITTQRIRSNEDFTEKYASHDYIFNQTTTGNQLEEIREFLFHRDFSPPGPDAENLPAPPALLALIAYAPSLGDATKKWELLVDLWNFTENQKRQLFLVLKDELSAHFSALSEYPKNLEMVLVSQKNIWKVALYYYLGIEKPFKVVEENDPGEAVLVIEDGVPKLIEKRPNRQLSFIDFPTASNQFVPFRCMKLWFETVQTNTSAP